MDKPLKHTLLICGESGAGKSLSLRNLRDQDGVLYQNCEGGKALPFKNTFANVVIDDPEEVMGIFQSITDDEKHRFHTTVVDTISFMMNRYEAIHVRGAANGQAAWGNYGAFFPELIYDYVASCPANSIFLGHLDSELEETTGRYKTTVPVKGALKKNGLEAYFTTVVNCRKVTIKDIEKEAEEGPLLTITKRERMLGFKHVFQTQTTGKTVGDRIRSPLGLFSDAETFIDNDAQIVLDRLTEFYME